MVLRVWVDGFDGFSEERLRLPQLRNSSAFTNANVGWLLFLELVRACVAVVPRGRRGHLIKFVYCCVLRSCASANRP